jgi:hypothetical protein
MQYPIKGMIFDSSYLVVSQTMVDLRFSNRGKRHLSDDTSDLDRGFHTINRKRDTQNEYPQTTRDSPT